MQYIKKPIPVDAWQIDLLEFRFGGEYPEWVEEARRNHHIGRSFDNNSLIINTLEGEMRASEGDYLIKGPKGDYWFNKKYIFEELYEPVEEEIMINKAVKNFFKRDKENKKIEETRKPSVISSSSDGYTLGYVPNSITWSDFNSPFVNETYSGHGGSSGGGGASASYESSSYSSSSYESSSYSSSSDSSSSSSSDSSSSSSGD